MSQEPGEHSQVWATNWVLRVPGPQVEAPELEPGDLFADADSRFHAPMVRP